MAQEPPAQRGSSAVGTDLNRNWSLQWGCCGGSSGTFSSETYRGPSPFSAPETQRLRDFVNSRVVGGVQQIRAAIDFHTYSELVLWPYGYTLSDTARGMTADDQATFAALGRDDGRHQRLHARAVQRPLHRRRDHPRLAVGRSTRSSPTRSRCTRARSSPGFYPPDEVIARETSRNREAVLLLLEAADCPQRVDRQGGPVLRRDRRRRPSSPTTSRRRAAGRPTRRATDTATAGRFERGDPAATNSSGAKQLGTTTSGVNDLVTGRLAGAAAGDHDIDGGVTSITSPPIALTGSTAYDLAFQWYLAHGTNSSTADFVRVRVLSGSTSTTVFQQNGAASNRNGAWASRTVSLNAFAGQTVRIVVEAADASTASLVEAAVDDVRVTGR